MNNGDAIVSARLALLARAEELKNVLAACREARISRSNFYKIKAAFQKCGSEGLAPVPRRRPRMPNQTPPELEQRILEMTARHPNNSYVAIGTRLRLTGIGVTASAVRGVWRRHRLLRSTDRLAWRQRSVPGLVGPAQRPDLDLAGPSPTSHTPPVAVQQFDHHGSPGARRAPAFAQGHA
jgi:hypothetical protein